MAEWQPIETAPRDGTLILGWTDVGVDYDGKGPRLLLIRWRQSEYEDWITERPDENTVVKRRRIHDTSGWISEADEYSVKPTHWMPLPDPPKD